VSRSGYYNWLKQTESSRAKEDQELLKKIQQVYDKSRGTYGSPRVYAALKKQGYCVGRKRVERLMREAGLQARAIKHYRRLAGLHRYFDDTENKRLVMGKPTGINQQWVADLTYIKVNNKWHYLATVMDLYSRKIIGWSLGCKKNVELTTAALKHAIRKRQPAKGVLFHTDRGTEYRAYGIRAILKRHHMIASTNRPYRSIDNAEMESFFKTLKGDVIRGKVYHNEQQLRTDLRSYINHFYNTQRLHSSLRYCSPNEYEAISA